MQISLHGDFEAWSCGMRICIFWRISIPPSILVHKPLIIYKARHLTTKDMNSHLFVVS